MGTGISAISGLGGGLRHLLSRNAQQGVHRNRPTCADDGRAERKAIMTITNERLMSLVSELIDLALDSTGDAELVESRIRSLGFNDEELQSFGLDVSED